MNVKTLCLSILYNGDASGYDIRRMCTDEEFAYFVEASYGSIYPALAKLEEEGSVTSQLVPQDGKPARRVYTITEAGRQAFAEQLSGPLAEDVFRSPFLLFARFAHILPRDLVEQRCNEFLKRQEDRWSKLETATEDMECTAADEWIIDFGRAIGDVAMAYMRTHMHKLIDLAQAEPAKNAAE
ncbi:PadR family transcriptional regulator [Devosia sp. 63-57]|mgnify:CR=1 FL=1|uniref:PadR family transcriptional regulator n=1 Tax=Devosia sp. 63-57 TaxID=1895751 RepID=UPI00086D57E1|nr:PadR family transcriptional regulator [Devosia sp. 63-57]ODT47319.1 MAG: hypothetical protein ABS74_13615 [Pelagibacterium sp. SCN 63-126]ODU86996.1 MAG: hypothetical protein ABT14_06025 [Pelagibacterium sp. SCN 63-17]OJX42973.1 MAG: hypothetical protein BGO80_16255 [Devosia sp. 63-57]